MITIYCDFQYTQQVKTDNYTIAASQVRDYIPLRQHLRRALNDEDHDYTIYLQSRILARWLQDLRDYEPHIIHWEETNLREQFRQKFGFLLPSEIDETAIRDLQLLNLPFPDAVARVDPIGWILGQRIDRVWAHTRPYKGHLADLAAWAVQVEQLHSSLKSLMRERLVQWREIDNRYQIFFDRSWQDAGEALLLRWALRSYSIQFSLRQQLDSVPLEDCSRYADLCHKLLSKYNTQLRQFWSSWLASNPSQDIVIAIRQMSGLTDVELNIFEQWARTHLSLLTATLLNSAREHFSFLPQTEPVLKRLEELVPPPPPHTPDVTWSTEKWLDWATDEYLPYFAWIIRNNQPRDTQMALADHFANWLVDIYPGLLFDHRNPIAANQFSKIREVLDSDQADVILWLIVDGLTWWQGKKLADVCAKHDMGVMQTQPMISALPTITSISKRALAQGYLSPASITQPIAQILESCLTNDMMHTRVYTQHHEMEKAFGSDIKPGVYALFYNALDHHCHEIDSFTDDESVDGHLSLISRIINEGFQRCLEQGLRAKAFISSDHGSTLLPSLGVVLKVPSFAHELEGEDTLENELLDKGPKSYRRTRICAIDRIPEESNLKYIERDWYLLRQDVFNLPQHFLIPKGYAAVGRRPRGWTHGGATPEEVIVAFIELQPAPIPIIEPVVEITGYLLPRNTSTLQVTIANPNMVPLKVVQLVISGTPVNVLQSTIKPIQQSKYEIDMPAATGKGATQTLEWTLICEGGGHHSHFKGATEVPIRRLQVSKVDELFEDTL